MSDEHGSAQEPAAIALFDDETAEKTIRRVWHDNRWFFSVIDVIGALTDAPKPRQYWFDMKRRIQDEGFLELSQCRLLKMPASDGKLYETDCADFAAMMSLLFALPAWRRRPKKPASQNAGQETCNSGIYAIVNILTQDQYIGSSGDIAARLKQHKGLLRQGKHHARLLQEAWNSYGEEVFQFAILEAVPDIHLLEAVEQRYLDEEGPVYNGARIASNTATSSPIPTDRFRKVLFELFELSGFGQSSPVFRTIRDAILMGVLRPGPNFHLVLEAENSDIQSCEELSTFMQKA
jgi:hypothetical protein